MNAVGPVNKNLRQCDPEVTASEPKAGPGQMDDGIFEMLPKKMDKVVAVICDKEGKGDCTIVRALRQRSKADKVVALWDCPAEGKTKTNDALTQRRHRSSCRCCWANYARRETRGSTSCCAIRSRS